MTTSAYGYTAALFGAAHFERQFRERYTVSTSETTTFNRGPCPCGQGHIAQHVTTQDNPWSTADIAYSIDCPRCALEWRLDGQTLVLRSSEAGHAAAAKVEAATSKPLHALVQQIVSHHFASFTAPNKKAEHAELVRLGLTRMSYRQYLMHRRNGGTIATAAVPARNQSWLKDAATRQGRMVELEALSSAHAAAEMARKQAYEHVVRRRIA